MGEGRGCGDRAGVPWTANGILYTSCWGQRLVSPCWKGPAVAWDGVVVAGRSVLYKTIYIYIRQYIAGDSRPEKMRLAMSDGGGLWASGN